jgi:hypothetical protein
MLAGLPPEGRAAAWEDVADELRQFEDAKGFDAPSELIVGVGQR